MNRGLVDGVPESKNNETQPCVCELCNVRLCDNRLRSENLPWDFYSTVEPREYFVTESLWLRNDTCTVGVHTAQRRDQHDGNQGQRQGGHAIATPEVPIAFLKHRTL